MSLGLIITMGSVTVGGAIIEKVLGSMGKVDEANMVSVVSKSMLAVTVVGCVIKVFGEVRRLGN
jgi:hypothetical protein